MGFRKRNAGTSDNRSKSAIIIGKPASQLDQIDALKFVKKKLTNVEQMKIDEQKKASIKWRQVSALACNYRGTLCSCFSGRFALTFLTAISVLSLILRNF